MRKTRDGGERWNGKAEEQTEGTFAWAWHQLHCGRAVTRGLWAEGVFVRDPTMGADLSKQVLTFHHEQVPLAWKTISSEDEAATDWRLVPEEEQQGTFKWALTQMREWSMARRGWDKGVFIGERQQQFLPWKGYQPYEPSREDQEACDWYRWVDRDLEPDRKADAAEAAAVDAVEAAVNNVAVIHDIGWAVDRLREGRRVRDGKDGDMIFMVMPPNPMGALVGPRIFAMYLDGTVHRWEPLVEHILSHAWEEC